MKSIIEKLQSVLKQYSLEHVLQAYLQKYASEDIQALFFVHVVSNWDNFDTFDKAHALLLEYIPYVDWVTQEHQREVYDVVTAYVRDIETQYRESIEAPSGRALGRDHAKKND